MGDVDDRAAGSFEFAHDRKQPLRLLRIQDRGRFIHQQQPVTFVERLGELDHLFAGGRQFRDRRIGIDIGMKPCETPRGLPAHCGAVEQPETAPLPAEKNIFGHGQVFDEVELLRNPADRDTGFELNPAGGRFDDSGQTFRKGRLSGAVFTDQAEDAAGLQRERHAVERLLGIVTFGQIFNPEHRFLSLIVNRII